MQYEESYVDEYLTAEKGIQPSNVSLTDILNDGGANNGRAQANATFASGKVALEKLELGTAHEGSVYVAPNHGVGHRSFRDFNTGNSATAIANWVSKTNGFKILKQ